jgi:hypothetical protein
MGSEQSQEAQGLQDTPRQQTPTYAGLILFCLVSSRALACPVLSFVFHLALSCPDDLAQLLESWVNSEVEDGAMERSVGTGGGDGRSGSSGHTKGNKSDVVKRDEVKTAETDFQDACGGVHESCAEAERCFRSIHRQTQPPYDGGSTPTVLRHLDKADSWCRKALGYLSALRLALSKVEAEEHAKAPLPPPPPKSPSLALPDGYDKKWADQYFSKGNCPQAGATEATSDTTANAVPTLGNLSSNQSLLSFLCALSRKDVTLVVCSIPNPPHHVQIVSSAKLP